MHFIKFKDFLLLCLLIETLISLMLKVAQTDDLIPMLSTFLE